MSQKEVNQKLVIEIRMDIEYLNFIKNSPNKLTEEEKNSLEKMPEDQRLVAKEQLMKRKEEVKQDKLKGIMSALETKIAGSGVSVETAEDLHEAFEQAKDAGYEFSSDAKDKVRDARVEPEDKSEKKDVLGESALKELYGILGKATTGLLVAVLTVANITRVARRNTQRRQRGTAHTRP